MLNPISERARVVGGERSREEKGGAVGGFVLREGGGRRGREAIGGHTWGGVRMFEYRFDL